MADPFEDEDDDRPPRRPWDDDEFEDRPRRRSRDRDQAEDDYSDGMRLPRHSSDGMGQAAMITGILSICLTIGSVLGSCFCFVGIVGVIVAMIVAIVSITLGFMARARTPGSGTGLTGILTGIASLFLGVAILLLLALGIGILALRAPPAGGGAPPPNVNKPRLF